MAELTPEILAEKENVEQALENLSEAMRRPNKTVVELCKYYLLAAVVNLFDFVR